MKLEPVREKDLFIAKYRVYHKGTLIYGSDSRARCKQIVEALENEDVQDNCYVPGSYEIKKTPQVH